MVYFLYMSKFGMIVYVGGIILVCWKDIYDLFYNYVEEVIRFNGVI